MRLIALNNEIYQVIEEYILNFNKKKIFSLFHDRFIFIKMNNKNYVFAISKDLGNKTSGLLIFHTNKSITRLNDTTQSENGFKTILDDFISICLVSKSKLKAHEKAFIKNNHISEKNKYVFLETHVRGIETYTTTTKEAKEILSCLFLLDDLFTHHLEEAKDALSDRDILVINYSKKRHKGEFFTTNVMPEVEYEEKFSEINEDFIEEVKNYNHSFKEATIALDFIKIPCKVKECNIPINPMFFSYTTPGEKYDCDMSFTLPSYLEEVTFSILKNFFNKFGIPQKLIINDRDLYNVLYKTLSYLNIDVIYRIKQTEAFDVINSALIGIFPKMFPLEPFEYIDINDPFLVEGKTLFKDELAPKVAHDVFEHIEEENDNVDCGMIS